MQNKVIDWSRIFYQESPEDVRDMEILKDLGYLFIEHRLVSRQFSLYLISGHKENL